MTNSSLLWAAPGDTVRPYVSESVTYDDNLLRISRNADPVLASGHTSVSDTIKQTTVGVGVDWKQGRHALMLDASINESRFSRFTTLDYQGNNLLSRWDWQLGNSVTGEIGYTKSKTLDSFAEKQRLVDNLSIQEREFFNGVWQVQSRLQVDGYFSRSNTYSDESSHNNTYIGNSTKVFKYETINYAVGATYTPPSGNQIGIRSTRLLGKYLVQETFYGVPGGGPGGPGAPGDPGGTGNPGTPGNPGSAVPEYPGVPVDSEFTQHQLLATLNWLYSGHLRINGQAGVVSRTHHQISARDFSGKTMRGTLTWLATGKSQVDLTAWSEVDAYENLTASFTLSKGISLGPSLKLTNKANVSAQLKHLQRKFLSEPGLLFFPQPVRRDTINSISLSGNYQPTRATSIAVSVQTERRSSNWALMDYTDNTCSLSLSVKF